MGKYAYRPYHPWRHGHRREKFHLWALRSLKIILVIELLILSVRYIEANTSSYFYESENADRFGNSEEVYGIGFEADEGELFWFHRKIESEQP